MHPVPPRIEVPSSLVADVRELFESNRPLQALEKTKDHPLHLWPWGAPAVLAGQLSSWLGGNRQGSRIHLLNYRHAPWHDEALLYRVFQLQDSHGILTSLHETEGLLRDHPFADDSTMRFDMVCHRARILGSFRDFPRALACIDEAIAAVPDRAWYPVIKSMILGTADRREEALEWAERADSLNPGYRLATLRRAEILIQLARTDEAAALLEEQLAATEVGTYAVLLQSIHSEREDAPAALAALEQWRQRQPLLDKTGLEFYHSRRADLLLVLGQVDEARHAAELSKETYHLALAKRLAEPEAPDRRRVRLPVPFIRQHHLTCAPATLAALASYWQRPADHLEIADSICYDGTPYYHQRWWATHNGFAAVEFTVSYHVAKDLIDAGIPFALSTVEPTSAHLQAVTGYDDRAGLVIMRDPTFTHFTEAFADLFFERYGATGPRGLVILPADQAHRLDAIDLPDRSMYDQLFTMAEALEHHRREQAGEVFENMEREHPGHRVTELARLSLAHYDADPGGEELAARRLLERFPADQWIRMAHFRIKRRTATHDESLALIDHARLEEKASPLFELERASLLASDGREIERTEKSFRRFLRLAPHDINGLAGLADTLTARNRDAEALGIWRLAATLEDTNEAMARNYFSACLRQNRAEEGLAFLNARFETHGTKSPAPAIALFQAYEALERRDEGFLILDRALALRPDDGTLRLFQADACSSVGRSAEARAALDEARPRVSRLDWLRRAAMVNARLEDNSAARAHWEDLLSLTPLDTDAQRAVISYTAEIDGTDAALERLEKMAADHPDFHPLLELRYDWYLREGRTAEAAEALRGIIAAFPLADWAHRALSHVLSVQSQHEEALASAKSAEELAPHLTYCPGQVGEVHLARREFAEATSAFRRSLELSIDNAASMRGLFDAATDPTTRNEAVAFLREQLVTQITNGSGVRAFRDIARPHVDPAQLLAILTEARDARPDLVETWSALTQELLDRGEFDAARAEAAAMLSRFPYSADAHRLRAVIEQRSGRLIQAEAAWSEALRVVPGWAYAMRGLGEVLEGLGRLGEAAAMYRRAAAQMPLEAPNHGMLADVLWRSNHREQALAAIRRAVTVDPGYNWGWNKLHEWGNVLGEKEAATTAAQELTRRRPAEPRSWLILAEMAANADDHALERSAIEQGLAVAPENMPLWDHKAMACIRGGDLAGALAACNPPPFHGKPPRELRGRRAWILMQAGQPEAAAKELDSLLEEHPDFIHAHHLRYDLHTRQEHFDKARENAEHLARLSPSDPSAHGRVAETWIRLEQPEKALPSLRRALNLDPSYSYAVRHLLFHATAENDGPEAERLVAHAARFCDPAFALRCEIVTRAEFRQKALLAEALQRFLVIENVDQDTTNEVLGAARKANPKTVQAALNQAIADGTIRNGPIVRDWAWHFPGPIRKTAARLRAAKLPEKLEEEGWDTLLFKLDHNSIHPFLSRFRKHYRSNRLWAESGGRLAALGLRSRAAKWFSDWQKRQDLEPWMMIEAIHAIEAASGPVTAAPLRRHLMSVTEPFRDRYLHGIGFAWTEAREGRSRDAAALLDGFDPEDIVAYYKAIFHFTRILLAVLPDGPPPDQRPTAIRHHWAEASVICANHPRDAGLKWFKQLTARHACSHPDAAFMRKFSSRGLLGFVRRLF